MSAGISSSDASTIFMFELVGGIIIGIILIVAIVMFILWNRRKLKFTNFLTETGSWKRKSWKEIPKKFEYEGNLYKFDLKKCTRDILNRPIAHYYVGNPEQMEFSIENLHKNIKIGTKELSTKDWQKMMLSKIITDIFADDNLMLLLIVIAVLVIVCAIASVLIINGHTPTCNLSDTAIKAIKDIMHPAVGSVVQ